MTGHIIILDVEKFGTAPIHEEVLKYAESKGFSRNRIRLSTVGDGINRVLDKDKREFFFTVYVTRVNEKPVGKEIFVSAKDHSVYDKHNIFPKSI